MLKKYIINLSIYQREQLEQLINKGKISARKYKRIQIILMSESGYSDIDIATTLKVSVATIERVRKKFVQLGLESTLHEKPRPGKPKKLAINEEVFLIATACSDPPNGRVNWTMQLLANKLVQLEVVDSISSETIRRTLKKKEIKPWLVEQWCIPTVDAEFVFRMEDVLDVYAQSSDKNRPIICFDERPTQLLSDNKIPIPPKVGQKKRIDYEYERMGNCNLFIFLEPRIGWRHIEVTDRRTSIDFAHCMKDLVDIYYPEADLIKVVMDNLNTHTPASLYKAFKPEEARRILNKLEFHYTPKHGSWLNMAEIELSILSRQCLNRRIPLQDILKDEIAAWEEVRNQEKATVEWKFTTEAARKKLNKLYPKVKKENDKIKSDSESINQEAIATV